MQVKGVFWHDPLLPSCLGLKDFEDLSAFLVDLNFKIPLSNKGFIEMLIRFIE